MTRTLVSGPPQLLTSPATGCPKRMVFGPCGGVRPDGGCEMAAYRCVFDALTDPDELLVQRTGTAPGRTPSTRPEIAVPMILTDLSTPPADAATLQTVARLLAPTCDAVLVGDHQDRPDFPPSTLARLISEAGATPWVTLACRDRNRITLEQELRALALDDLATVLCVTGDGRAFDVRPDVSQAFDLDGTRLAALAASLGLRVAVPETPTAPPVNLRPRRLVHKQRAGARLAALNHVPTPAELATFVEAARAEGLTMPVIASVVVFTDERSAAVLAALPGVQLDPDRVESVLTADDPIETGIAAAVRNAVELLAVPGVAGVNLSGLASARGVGEAAEIQAEIGRRIRAERVLTMGE